MSRYIVKRLLWLIPVILGVCVFIFAVMSLVPGDPARMILGPGATAEELLVKRHELGLDAPFIVRLLRYMRDVFLRLDFGRSYTTGTLISAEILHRLPKSAIVGITSIALALLMGVPLGVTAAVRQNGLADRVCMIIAMLGISMPDFWLALMLVLLFSLKLGVLPSTYVTGWTSYILPCIVCSIGGMAGLARQARSSMLEVIRSDYITTARAKGVSERGVIYRHALPNALIPVITIAGSRLAGIFGGLVVIENVFSIPGVGSYMVNAINNRDYPAIESCVLILAVIFSVVMVLVDLVYAFVDPRIKAQYAGGSKHGRKHGKRHRHGGHGRHGAPGGQSGHHEKEGATENDE